MAKHLTLSGAAGVYASTPSTTGLDVTNDLDIMVQVRADFTTSAAERSLIGRRASPSTFALVYRLTIFPSDVLVLEWTTAADVDVTATCTANLSTVFPNRGSDMAWLRATLDIDNGASAYEVKFWYSRDVTDDPDAVTWTQLGTTITGGAVTDIIDGRTSILEIGSYNSGAAALFTGDVFRGVVRDGIAGTIIADFNAEDFTLGDTSGATANDSTGKTWTVNGAAIITDNPVIAGTAETAVSTAGTSHAITLPTGGAASDLYMILVDIGSTSATFNTLTDWAEDLDEAVANGLKILRYTGTGVPSNPTFTSSAATRSASIAFRIHGADKTTAPQIGTTATGTSTTADPPSVTPTGGTSKDYLSIAFYGSAGEEADDDTWGNSSPTNWLPAVPWQKACGVAGTNLGGLIAAAYRQITTGAALDPGTFNQDVSFAWRSQQILVHPAAGGGDQTLDGSLFSVAPTFGTGAVAQVTQLDGVAFTRAPTFGTGAVTPVNTLAGVLFTRVPTFPTGVLVADQTLTGVLFSHAPVFGTGAVQSIQTIPGVLFTRAPTFPAGAVVQAPAGVVFTRAPTFPAGAVTSSLTIPGVLFTRAPVFGVGVVTSQQTIPGVLFTRSPIFGTGEVRVTQTLAGVLFTRSPVFGVGIATQAQILAGVLFSRSPTFPVGVATSGPVTLNGVLLTRSPTFGNGSISLVLIGATFTRVPVFGVGSAAPPATTFWEPAPVAAMAAAVAVTSNPVAYDPLDPNEGPPW